MANAETMFTRRAYSYQTELSNMLIKMNVLNEIKKERSFTQGFKDCIKRKRISKKYLKIYIADKVN